VGVFALNPGKQNTYSTAVIFPGGAEDVVTVEADGRWLTVEATVGGHRFAQSSVYLETAPKQRVDFFGDGWRTARSTTCSTGSCSATSTLYLTQRIDGISSEATLSKGHEDRRSGLSSRKSCSW
jgi:hypothetical protein